MKNFFKKMIVISLVLSIFISTTVTATSSIRLDDSRTIIGDSIEPTIEKTENIETQSLTRVSTTGTWIQAIDGRWWYLHQDGTYTQNNWEYINGIWYYFDSEGWMVTGWQKINGAWYYFNTDGAMQIGWQKISSTWYYFEPSGAMRTSNLAHNGSTYTFLIQAP